MKRPEIKHLQLILLSVTFMLLADNVEFFRRIWHTYTPSPGNLAFMLSLGASLWLVTALLTVVVSSKFTTKPILMFLLMVAAPISYFMSEYHIVLDYHMLRNVFETNMAESADLLSLKLIVVFVVLGIVPAVAVGLVKVDYGSWREAAIKKLAVCVVLIVLLAVNGLAFSKYYASFFREHKALRYNANPPTFIFSMYRYLCKTLLTPAGELQVAGLDARINEPDGDGDKELVVLVIGESARADRFSLNGYPRETNPLLGREEVVSLTDMHSCGTSTVVSVPCMFSLYDKETFSDEKGMYTENILDVLQHTGKVDVLWRDNNSDSKGVALRVPFEDYADPARNTVCDVECRDVGMLVGLDEFVRSHRGRDKLIVLHQMGNHGPAYFKRYPPEFERFTPVCKTNQLEKCSAEEIGNAYDNAILYTDYFLAQVIEFLKRHEEGHETAMIYLSDHGESLGEQGLYLHGLPSFLAPNEQTHVASVLWLSEKIKEEIDFEEFRAHRNADLTHDNLFHSLLGIFEVETSLYRPELDVFHMSRWE